MATAIEPTFAADAEIATFFRRIDRHGSVTIADGILTLLKHSGEVIAEAPITDIRADKAPMQFGGAARIEIAGHRYLVMPTSINRYVSHSVAASTANLVGEIKRLKKGRELTSSLLSVIEAERGTVGKA